MPVQADQRAWSCGFYPGLEPGQQRSGIAASFEAARLAFETLLPTVSGSAFQAWRRDRDARAEMAAKRARGEKLDSEIHSSLMRCVCGVTFDSHKPDESAPHRKAYLRGAVRRKSLPMKHIDARPYADAEAAACKLLELAAGVEPVDGRIDIEKINGLFLSKQGCGATGPEFGTGIRYAIEKGWLDLHESETYVTLMPPGEDLLGR